MLIISVFFCCTALRRDTRSACLGLKWEELRVLFKTSLLISFSAVLIIGQGRHLLSGSENSSCENLAFLQFNRSLVQSRREKCQIVSILRVLLSIAKGSACPPRPPRQSRITTTIPITRRFSPWRIIILSQVQFSS